jgi:hypothetical protein
MKCHQVPGTSRFHREMDRDLEYWMIYFNESLMKKGVGLGLVFVAPTKCA